MGTRRCLVGRIAMEGVFVVGIARGAGNVT